MADVREHAITSVMRELAETEARNRAEPVPRRRARRITGPSVVVSLRLDPAEFAALEAKAVAAGIKPTVLARNLIRTGLAARSGEAVAPAVDQLEAAVPELRSLVP